MRLATLCLLVACSSASNPTADAKPSEAASKAAPATRAAVKLDELSLTRLDGAPVGAADLSDKVLLFVNVASKCGFTRQYEGLQALYAELGPRGFEIVGVPSNQFGGQEPGSAEEIASFCKMNYGVTFTMLEKQEVKGSGRSDLYDFLVTSEAGAGKEVGWNFEKFLVGRDGQVIARYGSRTTPADGDLRKAIESALGPAS